MTKKQISRKPLSAAVAAATFALAASGGVQAAAYYYSLYDLSNVNVYAEYQKDVNGDGIYNEDDGDYTVWARPASNENDPRAATFNSDTSATYTGSNGDTGNDGGAFNSHVPPAGFFPIDAPQSFVTNDGTAAPAENTFAQTSPAAGNYSRADAYIDTEGVVVNDFNVLESAGETSQLVAEGRSTTTTLFSSQAQSAFTGYLDLEDVTLDDPGDPLDIGTGYDDTNLGWTGRVMLTFDYATAMVLTTDLGDIQAQATYDISFDLYADTETGDPTSDQLIASMDAVGTDPNCDGAFCGSELIRTTSRSNGGDFSTSATGTFMQIWDLNAIMAALEIDPTLYFELTFQHNVAGRAQAQIPEPGILALFSLGLLGLGGMRRLRKV